MVRNYNSKLIVIINSNPKINIILQAYATCSELPSFIGTMIQLMQIHATGKFYKNPLGKNYALS